MKKLHIGSFILSALLISVCPAFSSETETARNSDQILSAVREKAGSLKSFTAKFVKLKQTLMPPRLLLSEGTVCYDSGKLLIEITGALPMKLLFMDSLLTLYYPDLSKVEKNYVGKTMLRKYFDIGEPLEKLKQKYDIRLISKPFSPYAYRLQFTPRAKYILKYMNLLGIIVNAHNWLPTQIEFRTANGDYTTLGLNFLSVDEPVPPAVFTIEIPKNRRDSDSLGTGN